MAKDGLSVQLFTGEGQAMAWLNGRPYEPDWITGTIRWQAEVEGRSAWGTECYFEMAAEPAADVQETDGWAVMQVKHLTMDSIKRNLASPLTEQHVPAQVVAAADLRAELGTYLLILATADDGARAVLPCEQAMYFVQRYPGATFRVADGWTVVGVFQGDTLVGGIMPMRRPDLWAIPLTEGEVTVHVFELTPAGPEPSPI